MSNQSLGNAAQAALALRNIIKGALTGGLHGAAIGAAKSFLPEIVKAGVIIIAILILLPYLVFAALPNILFGYSSSPVTDIIELTGKAFSIDAAYKEVQSYSQEEIDRIIQSVRESYSTEDGNAEYDNVEISEDMDNTNIFWFIAITSVAHQQDLFSMSEESIRNSTVSKITFMSSMVETKTEDEDGVIEVMRTLRIDIKDLNPYELMDKLGFSDEERNWAQVLYSSLADDQYVGYTDTDGEGYYNTDYGNVTFIGNSVDVTYYNQTDSRWGNLSYGKSGTIGSAGCGPTALAIVVASLRDSSVTPKEVAEWSVKNGYRAEGSGSFHSLMPNGGRHYGLIVEGIGTDRNKLIEALESGKIVIAIMKKGHFTSGGHYIVLRGITSEGKILVADPASIKRSNQEWSLGIILNEANRGAAAGGPFWVFS
jgi:hypothetical protein